MTTFMFPGQGSQSKGMGKELFRKFPKEILQADDILGYSIQELCISDPYQRLANTQYTQPALYVVEVLSFIDRIKDSPLPDYCIGHSLGEYSALFAAGAFDFETGLKLVKKRGELMAKITGGAMLAVINLPIERINILLKMHNLETIDGANLNSPKQTVLSGSATDIAQASKILSTEASKCIILPVSGAFHSRYMQDAAIEFSHFIKTFTMNALRTRVIANVNVQPYTNETIKSNLVHQITSPVKWAESIYYLRQCGETQFIEIGPGNVLTRLLTQF